MNQSIVLCVVTLGLAAIPASVDAQVDRDAARYVQAINKINEDHARNPGKELEEAMAKKLPADAKSALQRVLQVKPAPAVAPALVQCGEAAWDLDLAEDFNAIRLRLEAVAPGEAKKLGRVVSRPRFVVRGIGDFADGYLDRFAELFDAILVAYDEVFGFAEFSKVPGKKLRVRLHLEPEIKQPPHFAPEFPWHSEIDFPVSDPTEFRSPTPKGQFLFYGLCHELGHVIAMWGDLQTMEDHHSWAHYTGVAIVEHLTNKMKDAPLLQSISDVRWRSLENERKLPANQVPASMQSAPGVMRLLLDLHDSAGPRAIGDAINFLDRENKSRRVNRVRYYRFADFRRALGATLKEETKKKAVLALMDGAGI
jgi:hypothetical protein